MSPQVLPAITLDYAPDGEFTLTAIERSTGKILAAAMSCDSAVATLRIDLQLIELGYDIYQADDIFN